MELWEIDERIKDIGVLDEIHMSDIIWDSNRHLNPVEFLMDSLPQKHYPAQEVSGAIISKNYIIQLRDKMGCIGYESYGQVYNFHIYNNNNNTHSFATTESRWIRDYSYKEDYNLKDFEEIVTSLLRYQDYYFVNSIELFSNLTPYKPTFANSNFADFKDFILELYENKNAMMNKQDNIYRSLVSQNDDNGCYLSHNYDCDYDDDESYEL